MKGWWGEARTCPVPSMLHLNVQHGESLSPFVCMTCTCSGLALMNSRESRYTKQQRRIEELEAEVRQLRVSEAAALAMLQAERQQAASHQGQLEVGVRPVFRPRLPSPLPPTRVPHDFHG
jgi:predicted nucleic acid-binding protein